MKIFNGHRLKIKSWCHDLDETALFQAQNLSALKDAFYHIALMPDAHAWFGMPIGWVVAMKSLILPNAVWKDIWCWVCAIKTSLLTIDANNLKNILAQIRQKIPLWPKHHKQSQDSKLLPKMNFKYFEKSVIYKEKDRLAKQIWTLWWWNHFIEIQKWSDGFIRIMIHSWSRNLGSQVADYYDKIAVNSNKKFWLWIPDHYKLAWLPIDSEEWKMYLQEMNYCVDFALANRNYMIEIIKKIFVNILPEKVIFSDYINIPHNYAAMEEHFGSNVWVHRKWATKADKDTVWIIPGSQWTSSFIVKWKGCSQSFKSCSHGAWRKLARNQAIEKLDYQKEKDFLDQKWILHAIRSKKDLQEAPWAYKDIYNVMKEQADLVEVLLELKPLAVVKG